ncbi:MAG: hypothetical protein HQ573_02460 [Desulfobacteraceae bacterium]|nr:hypothetical protein [Desulfobacteraceae bacterium]
MQQGKANLNEIVYSLKELKDPLMLNILKKILIGYDDLVSERLSQTKIYSSKARKGLGRHIGKGGSKERFCRGRKIRKGGYLRGGISAPQNLQHTLSHLLLAGTLWSPLHLGHERLRPKIVPITTDIKYGLMSLHSFSVKMKMR